MCTGFVWILQCVPGLSGYYSVYRVCLDITVCTGFIWILQCVPGLSGYYSVYRVYLDITVCTGFVWILQCVLGLSGYYSVYWICLDITVCTGFVWISYVYRFLSCRSSISPFQRHRSVCCYLRRDHTDTQRHGLAGCRGPLPQTNISARLVTTTASGYNLINWVTVYNHWITIHSHWGHCI